MSPLFRSRSERATGEPRAEWLVVGLRNPDREYAGTRHNVGGDAVALLARRHGASFKRERGMAAEVTELFVDGHRYALALPDTYMNESGMAVAPLSTRYVDGRCDRLIVVHDELDLDSGVVRVKVGGGTAGHNGLKSIDQHLRSLEFARVRIGIGKAPGRSAGAEFVLGRPGKAERVGLEVATEIAADAIGTILEEGTEVAMNTFNRT